ncbi:MAG: RluA family pseudouridine synthase [Bacteroidales bacterium]|jgi:23S rRNA pseudouridine1911/1915/1917 synthase|nr:RluA family pseudouridine synthase [Bacteroidales bacterium]
MSGDLPELNDNQEVLEESQDLYEHFRFVSDKGQGLLRIDKFLMTRIENATRNKVQQAARAGNILVNGQPVKPNYRVKPLDVISVVLSYPPREIELIAEHIPVEILYEDDDLLVVNKQAGMVVHPAYGNYTGTLVNALTYHLREISTDRQPGRTPFLVHRIDKDTSGVMLVAKNELAQARLAAQFFHHTTDRHYMALVWGDFTEDTGTITGHIGRSQRDRKVFAVFPDGSQGRHAVTHYTVLERLGYVTLVDCKLETGRTHQIRVHFQHIRHPLFGDETYGGNVILKGTTFTKYKQFVNNCFSILPRQALHARSIGFVHPTTKQWMQFRSDPPEDMAAVIEKWRRYRDA